jgi:anti-anti-sigma factor
MSIKTEEYDQVCVMTVEGDFTADNVLAAKNATEKLMDERHLVDFVLDLEKAPFIDSEGLEALLWMKMRCEGLFGQLKLVNLDENCRKILEITRLTHRFDCQADLTTALKTMR